MLTLFGILLILVSAINLFEKDIRGDILTQIIIAFAGIGLIRYGLKLYKKIKPDDEEDALDN